MSSKNLMQGSKPVKVHYRMYKSGRQWLFASMTVVTVGGSLLWGNQAHAATTTPTNNESADQTTVSGTASASSTVTLHESTSTTSQVSSSSAVSGDQQSGTSAMSQDSQASQASQVTNDSSSASQPAISEGQSAQSSAQTSSQASQTSQATSASSSVGQSATSVGQPSPAATNSIDGAANQSKSAVSSLASVADNQRITVQHVVSLANEQADSGTLMANLMTSGVNAANKIVATRASLLKDATPDSTFTWTIDDTGTTLTLNGGTPTESLYTMLTDAQREKIEHIVIANPVTIIGDVGKNFLMAFTTMRRLPGWKRSMLIRRLT
ncbi:KxYKxGKxW signal peptide domain-containing protein [Lactiplantibacillus songbeiensis]|uniref:KxYKxGKxW signal peptide domain-containing protein n=1 Tax=Lactiplantibacillus songbeiensis TaxID=2559920 RepID=A0ABW4BYE7_9LACO|nr:KxYKxGKxW signal peptide domain-containing protein [Lactiplantibacillus songbeiensis]